MKKILYSIASAALMLLAASCADFLEPKDNGLVDRDFVFSSIDNTRAAMKQVYSQWQGVADGDFYGNGNFYAVNLPGGDDSRHPEGYNNQLQRHIPEGFYENGKKTGEYNIDEQYGDFSNFYAVIARANTIISAMEDSDDFDSYMSASEPTELSQLYGEAVVARSTIYQMLIRYWGDVPFTNESGVAATGIAPRDSIYDIVIADLERVVPHMYRSGSVPGYGADKNGFSRTFAEASLANICMDAAGYQTRRSDLTYKDGEGKEISWERLGKANANADDAFYARRADWKKYVEKAQKYFKAVIDNPGNVVFHETDPRATTKAGQEFGNPYQYFFQQTMDNDIGYADESIFEYPLTWEVSNGERPYSNGRVSNGGGSNNFPCKAYGQGRINPAFYWGIFDPKDMRRDVSACVTGHTGGGAEVLIPFTPNSKSNGGGLTNNKWDEGRQVRPNALRQRKSGINGPWMRISEVYLGYAEACAMLGDNGNAMTYLKKVRERSFPAGQAGTEAFVAAHKSLVEAVLDERMFEFAGEGDRRWTMIRSGQVFNGIRRTKELQKAMIEGVEEKGYYRFENGNEFPAYVWTKQVDAKKLYGYRLTTQCPAGKEDDPVLYPGWRGENDDWATVAREVGVTEANIKKNLKAGDMTNLAIKGLFKYIDPNSDEAKALEADGYKKVEYGLELAKNKQEYVDNFFKDFDYESAPVYLFPVSHDAMKTIPGLTNGYGFQNN